MTNGHYTAIILAAQRPGIVNPLAKAYSKSHKCLIEINGIAMLQRIVKNTMAASNVSKIVISIEDANIALSIPEIKRLFDDGAIAFVKSELTLADSIVGAIEQVGIEHMPFFVTTADNCLHTPEIIDYFLNQVRETGAEAAFAMTPDTLVQETYPGTGKITGQHKLIDGIYSNCNMYAITSAAALKTAELFRQGGQFGRKEKRKALIPVVGLWSFFLYRYGLLTFKGMSKQASRALKIKARGIKMPFADAPIDADDQISFDFIEARLKEREV
ncbi:NTP transferase domain-containing protein [Kordiimonas pumila]|uniref:NTP transferase domain-containing protein n=1 Tax=Kordiimonas pumila TaxID=2161677 RepID=A0ABV7D099_9PROT|nr:NTP transferase domain-containing protein [Kordiimonas pumila]